MFEPFRVSACAETPQRLILMQDVQGIYDIGNINLMTGRRAELDRNPRGRRGMNRTV